MKMKKFPILGGRLLKQTNVRVSSYPKEFPILGGRLLKKEVKYAKSKEKKFPILGGRLLKKTDIHVVNGPTGFQSLEGGY